MGTVKAYEGISGNLHRCEGDALAEIIEAAGRGTLGALLNSSNPDYQPDLQDALLRAAEKIQRLRKKHK
jgi:hypothetical protein